MQKKLLGITVLVVIASLSACHNDDEKNSGSFSKTEAQTKISAFNSSATTDLQDLSKAKGLSAITDLTQLTASSDPFGGRASTDKKKLKVFFQSKGHTFRSIIDKKFALSGRSKGEDPFNFADNTGVYTWNADTEEFERTGESNIIKIQFPTEGSPTNNAELQIKAYSEIAVHDDDTNEDSYEPTVIKASLLVDATEAASLDFTVSWDNKGFPLTANLSASVKPFTATVKFDVTASDKNTLSATLVKDQKTLFSTDVTVTYAGGAKEEGNLKTVSGFVQLIDLKLEGNVDMAGMDADVSQTVDLNKYVKLKVTTDNKKVGDIVFVTETLDGVESSVAYIQYADGSKEKLEDVIKPVTDELDKIEEDING
jgi:hypothetical protein